LQRPNRLQVNIPGDGPASDFSDDGKSMMALVEAENLVASTSDGALMDGTILAFYDGRLHTVAGSSARYVCSHAGYA
jgi:hypothetical protein